MANSIATFKITDQFPFRYLNLRFLLQVTVLGTSGLAGSYVEQRA